MLLRAASSRLRSALELAACVAVLGSIQGLYAGEPPSGSVADSISAEIGKIFEERKSAVVKVRAKDGLGIRYGSGFFADPSGTIFTHVGIVMKADDVTVIANGRELPARVLVTDLRSGLALLKVDVISPFIPADPNAKLNVASPLVMIGFPEDREASPSFGLVGGFDRQYLGQYFSTTHIRANMPVQRGQGGSPVLNMKGDAVGILVGCIEGGAACHILPIRAAEKVRMDYVRFGEMRPGWVGVQVEDGPGTGGSTAAVGALDPSTPAAQSGLKPGDVILKIGNVNVSTSEDVVDASYFLTAGDSTEIQVLRGSESLTVHVKPEIHPLAPRREMQAIAPEAGEKIQLE